MARPSRIVGQGYSQAGTFWGILNVSLRAYGAQIVNFEQRTLSKIGGEDKTDRRNPLLKKTSQD